MQISPAQTTGRPEPRRYAVTKYGTVQVEVLLGRRQGLENLPRDVDPLGQRNANLRVVSHIHHMSMLILIVELDLSTHCQPPSTNLATLPQTQ